MLPDLPFKSQRLGRHTAVFTLTAGMAAALAYCGVYAVRKPFAANIYEGVFLWGVQFKIVLVLAQVAGYALSKFIGIRLISGLGPAQRGRFLRITMGIAIASLLGFALTPMPWNALWMFVNGLPLGLAWGLIFGFLEGRKVTEALSAFLCANFILSSGLVKSVGQWLLTAGMVSPAWMPFVTAVLFVPLFWVSLKVLERLPPPSAADIAARTARLPMSSADRSRLLHRYAPGLMLLIIVYLTLTVLRDVRDNFAVELWTDLGFGGQAGILTTAELPIALFSLVVLGSLMMIKNNFTAFQVHHALAIAGALSLVFFTWLFQRNAIAPVVWMIGTGFALFLPYILFNGVLFDRMMASFEEKGNVGFLMYVADAIGYLGSVLVLLGRNFFMPQAGWVHFFSGICFAGAVLTTVSMGFSWIYFYQKKQQIFHQTKMQHDKA